MEREDYKKMMREISREEFLSSDMTNFFVLKSFSDTATEQQTSDAFTDKWGTYEETSEKEIWYKMQKDWYLKLYGFASEKEFANFLQSKKIIFDAGCGLGYKSEWFASLAPDSLVIGIDYSDAVRIAAQNYSSQTNLLFAQGDIANTPFLDGSIDYVSCDQVIMHTQNTDETFEELVRITNPICGEFSCYFYAKKALPRELLDDHFRSACSEMSKEELWDMSKQLTDFGKNLSELNVTLDVPDIPALNIKGGSYDLQRFLYWNFLKCFWNEDLGRETSIVTNYDWYSPSNARRYSKEEVLDLIEDNELEVIHFHHEEACYSGRFVKPPLQTK
jgi:ubiquinone/menaquinone biosynthesis C-methylase UbiE